MPINTSVCSVASPPIRGGISGYAAGDTLTVARTVSSLPQFGGVIVPTFSQSAFQEFGAGSGAVSFAGNVTAGNTIIVAAEVDPTSKRIATVTDSLGNLYTKVASANLSDELETWVAFNILGGACTVTVTGTSGTTVVGISAIEYANVGGVAAVVSTATGASGTPAGPAVTAPTANTLVHVSSTWQAGAGLTPGSGFTARVTSAGFNVEDGVVQAGSLTPTFGGTATTWDFVGTLYLPRVGRQLTKAWLTVKHAAADADPGLVQKIITPALTGAGQITAQGAGDGGQPVGTGALSFTFTSAETLAIGLNSQVYDIQAQLDDGEIATLEIGTLVLTQRITGATS